MLWKLLSELELELMMVDGETQILLLPGFTVAEVKILRMLAFVEIYN